MSGPALIVLLVAAIAFIVFMTARVRMHPFLVLIVTAFGLGLLSGLPAADTIGAIVQGFGGTIGYIGIVIAAGTVIGFILERSGGALVMATSVLRWVGEARSALAMSITGGVVSIPVFCDSGFVILSSLARSLAAKANASMALYAVALSLGLYTTHVFIPPTPGPIAAAGTLGADIGTVMIVGLVVAVPVLIATYLFAAFMGSRIYIDPTQDHEQVASTSAAHDPRELPSPAMAFAPILIPIVLIALKSVAEFPARPFGDGAFSDLLSFIGNPNVALIVGVFLAFLTVRKRGAEVYGDWVGEGLTQAGTIILITGAGGALGKVLQATAIGEYLGDVLASWNIGILLPFVIAAALKTAQGSSTVAIITTASLVVPLLEALGLDTGLGPVLVTLAIGAGAMTVSHANDSYFWVVSQCSGMSPQQAYMLQTVGSGVGGVTGMLSVYVLSLFMI